MKILAVDVGTGTQDILLFDSEKEVENCYKLVLPSPTVMLAEKIRAATQRGDGVVLTGMLMGGGPCAWAARDHAQAGFPLWVTPDAARTFDDDPARVAAMGATVIGEDEAPRLTGSNIVHLMMGDFDYAAIFDVFGRFGVDLDQILDAIAIAVFDHGDAPPGVSDRLFRFEYIERCLARRNSLTSFAFLVDEVPKIMTRMEATARVARAARPDLPIMLMDTAPAAVLGALEDAHVRQARPAIVANIGNFHCLAFRLNKNSDETGGIEGVFEHHTGEITAQQLEGYLTQLAQGNLTHHEIFDSNGHGAVMFTTESIPLDFLSITGPRRNFLHNSSLKPYHAAPFGDMMLTGSHGLVRAYTGPMPAWAEEIDTALRGQGGKSLW